jgi:hypothetical protein
LRSDAHRLAFGVESKELSTRVSFVSAVESAIEKVRALSTREARELLTWLEAKSANDANRRKSGGRGGAKRIRRHSTKQLLKWYDSVRLTTDWEPPKMPNDSVKPISLL